ncbi:MAG: pilus assembly protein TadG-related protein [Victivallales bacterium]
MNTKNTFRTESGQTMILGVIAVLILLVAVLFLFDIHSIIRVKVKAQTAADAAALTVANWQRHSLNLIGELNLVKACTVIATDFDPSDDLATKMANVTEKSEMITEMQSRVSFVGPMIGFGAAQQSAKNNGMNPVTHYSNVVRQHIDNLENDDYYGEAVGISQEIENYSWRWPYRDMVESVVDGQGGIAAAPNVDFASLPDVQPPWLMDLGLYNAISAQYWCYGTLRSLLKSYSFEGQWWQASIVSDTARFPEESEYAPIYIEYSAVGDTATFDLAKSEIDNEALERNNTAVVNNPSETDPYVNPLPYVKWCLYESRWDTQISPEWTTTDEPYYMRQPLKPEYNYHGAVAKMTCRADVKVLSSNYTVGKPSGTWLSASAAQDAPITCSALAKPLGKLSNGKTPNSVKMVLPVFDESRLIPIAMQDPTGLYDPFNQELYNLFEFLKWAADVNDIDNPGSSPPAGGQFYLACLQKLNNPEWRSKGYNRNYAPSMPTTAYDPASNPNGAGWLQMETYIYDAAGNIVSVRGTNEDTCDDWPGGPGGPRQGPSVLH